jgi:hypothetical protein
MRQDEEYPLASKRIYHFGAKRTIKFNFQPSDRIGSTNQAGVPARCAAIKNTENEV